MMDSFVCPESQTLIYCNNKLRQFADEDTCRLLESYLTGRRQRVKLGGEHSSWVYFRAPTVQHLHE